ncbi:MAG TPA: hypothetical protein VGR07_04755 [Thermoanaerobaculia bacterium]|jgi:hypothetical protein|nr:hypothetical protein [Thermoanaerobaculia bacterium]
MLRLRSRASLGLLVLFLAACGAAWAQGPAVRTVSVRQLLGSARGALTAAAQAANGPLSPGQAKNRPFWNAVDAMGRSLGAVETAFAARSPTFFDTLGAGSRTLAELKAVWSHAGVDAPAVRSGLETLSAAYGLLRGSYGWEALRRQQGGSLTADEQRRFQAMQQAEAALAERLVTLRSQAARAGDRQAKTDLDHLVAQARSLARAEMTLAAYLTAEVSAQTLQGEWAGDSRYAKPATRKAWKKAAPLVEDLTTNGNVGFVFSTDLSKVDGWAPLEAPVEVPADIADAADVADAADAADVAMEAAGSVPGGAPEGLAPGDEPVDREDGAPGTSGGAVLERDDDRGDAEAATAAEPVAAALPANEKEKDGKTAEKKDGKTAAKPETSPAAVPAPQDPALVPPPAVTGIAGIDP